MPKKKFPEEQCLAPSIEGRCNYPMSEEKRCSFKAGWGTQHVGEGTCRKHGGYGAPIKHGLYSKYHSTTPLKQVYEEFLDNPYWKSLQDEVAAARAHFALLNEADFEDHERFFEDYHRIS